MRRESHIFRCWLAGLLVAPLGASAALAGFSATLPASSEKSTALGGAVSERSLPAADGGRVSGRSSSQISTLAQADLRSSPLPYGRGSAGGRGFVQGGGAADPFLLTSLGADNGVLPAELLAGSLPSLGLRAFDNHAAAGDGRYESGPFGQGRRAGSRQLREMPAAPGSTVLFLSALSSVGLWQLGRSARKVHFSNLPDWYHSGAPARIGHRSLFDLEFGGMPLAVFDEPVPPPFTGAFRRCEEALSPQSWLAPACTPRGPPFFSSNCVLP